MQIKSVSQASQSLAKAWQAIDLALPDSAQIVLETFAIKGLANVNQVMTFTKLTRDRSTRALDRLVAENLLRTWEKRIHRPGRAGQAPRIYLLTETGAQMLDILGCPETRPCDLGDDRSILHALSMVDVALAAIQDSVHVITDRELRAGEQTLRPDHQILLQNGSLLLVEIEQKANTDTLRRVVESLRHKQAFFSAKSSCLPEVRMLVNLPRGKEWEITLRTWQKGLKVVSETGELPFRLFALPLDEFLNRTDWAIQRRADWRELTPEITRPSALEPIQSQANLDELLTYTVHEDRIILAALWQDFLENAAHLTAQFPKADPEFLLLIRQIHTASFDDALPILEQSSPPYASLYLLNHYLTMHDLRKLLRKALNAGTQKIRWNLSFTWHRMQVVINLFLKANGWRNDGPLTACVTSSRWDVDEPRNFSVQVRIYHPEILMGAGDVVIPTRAEVQETEQALAWVLSALFNYSQELGLGQPEFW